MYSQFASYSKISSEGQVPIPRLINCSAFSVKYTKEIRTNTSNHGQNDGKYLEGVLESWCNFLFKILTDEATIAKSETIIQYLGSPKLGVELPGELL